MVLYRDMDTTSRPSVLTTTKHEENRTAARNGQISEPEMERVRVLVRRMAGQKLPGERELAVQLQINRPRLRAILNTLQHEGLVESRPKSGTYALNNDGNRFSRVALIIDQSLKISDDPFFSHLVEALQRSIQSAGAHCLIVRTGGSGTRPPLEDGAIVIGLAGGELILDRRPSDPPAIGLFLDASLQPNRLVSLFQLADREAGAAASRYLITQGCSKLVFLGREDIPASSERLRGVHEAAALEHVPVQFVSAHLNYADGMRLGTELTLPGKKELLGIITTNDWMAVGLRTALQRRPDIKDCAIRIASFDGLPVAAEPSLEISSFAVPIDAIAADAVTELQILRRSPVAMGRILRYPLLLQTWSDSGKSGRTGEGTKAEECVFTK